MAVYLQQVALSCALGDNPEAIIDGLNNPPTIPAKIDLGLAEESVAVPYHSIAGSPIEQPNRLYSLLDQLLAPFFASLQLTTQQKATTALFFGSTSYDVGQRASAIEQSPSELVAQLMPLNTVPNWISNQFGLTGLQYAYNSACSSSMNALVHAHAMLEAGLIEQAIVVGCELYNPLVINGFYSLQLLATEQCQPFSQHDGMALGEAIAVGLLTKHKTPGALEIKAGLTETDSANITCTQGDGSAINQLVSRLLAGHNDQIDAIKCHGVGTNNADQAELNGLETAFGKSLPLIGFKPFFGNTLGAAGMAELALLFQLCQSATLPTTCQLSAERLRSLQGTSLLVNNFGFGGNNSCLWVQHHAD